MLRALFFLIITLFSSHNFGADINFDKGYEEYSRGNLTAAFKFWRESALAGNQQAAVNVGISYLNGKGVEKNYIEAIRWLKIAAIHGEVHSKHLLGEIYFKGQGVAKDNITARIWFGVSKAQGNTQSNIFCSEIDLTLSDSEKMQVNQIVNQCTLSQFVGCHF